MEKIKNNKNQKKHARITFWIFRGQETIIFLCGLRATFSWTCFCLSGVDDIPITNLHKFKNKLISLYTPFSHVFCFNQSNTWISYKKNNKTYSLHSNSISETSQRSYLWFVTHPSQDTIQPSFETIDRMSSFSAKILLERLFPE